MEFFVHQVWPLLQDVTLHIIAGASHGAVRRSAPISAQPGIELEGFVADVRPAYQRATLVVAPLVASAGTNIKILEAMVWARLWSAPCRRQRPGLAPGEDFVLVQTAQEMAAAIENLLGRPRRPCPHRSCRPRPCGTRLQLGHDRPRPVGPVPRTAGKLIPTRAATRLWDRAVTRGAREQARQECRGAQQRDYARAAPPNRSPAPRKTSLRRTRASRKLAGQIPRQGPQTRACRPYGASARRTWPRSALTPCGRRFRASCAPRHRKDTLKMPTTASASPKQAEEGEQGHVETRLDALLADDLLQGDGPAERLILVHLQHLLADCIHKEHRAARCAHRASVRPVGAIIV